jgi:hypothetical protein
LKLVVRYIEVDEQMAMIRVENGDDSAPVSTHSQRKCQQNPRQTDPSVASQNSY